MGLLFFLNEYPGNIFLTGTQNKFGSNRFTFLPLLFRMSILYEELFIN
jgi:hypothetical protein